TTLLASSPGLLWHADHPRTIGRPTHQRRRAASHPPVRPAHRTHLGLRRRARRPRRAVPIEGCRPRGVLPEEPDGGNLLVRIWGGPRPGDRPGLLGHPFPAFLAPPFPPLG